MYLNKNGVPFVTAKMLSEMKKGCNTGQCPPLETSTSYPLTRSKTDAPTLSNRLC